MIRLSTHYPPPWPERLAAAAGRRDMDAVDAVIDELHAAGYCAKRAPRTFQAMADTASGRQMVIPKFGDVCADAHSVRQRTHP